MAAKGFIAELPEMDPITPDREKLMDDFLLALTMNYGGEDRLPASWVARSAEDRRILAYKYLTARKWKVSDALKMATSTSEWRKSHGVDAMRLFPCAFPAYGYDADDVLNVLGQEPRDPNDFSGRCAKTIGAFYQSGFHFWDKTGHPVLLMFFGKCNVRELFKRYQQLANVGEKPTGPADRYHCYENECADFLARYRDATNRALPDGDPTKLNRRILGVTCVIDCEGLGYAHLWNPILDIVRCQFTMDASHYPEGLHRVLVINCPGMIRFAYTIVKGALDPRVQQKIIFCAAGKETQETMRLLMDMDKLPRFLGGEWDCPDGGPWGGISKMADTTHDDEASDAITEDISITAGKAYTREYPLTAGEEVSWEFASTTNHDVSFGATFFPSSSTTGGERPPVVVAEPQKIRDGADRFVAETEGRLVLTWDNASSWFRSKKLQVKIIKTEPLPPGAGDDV